MAVWNKVTVWKIADVASSVTPVQGGIQPAFRITITPRMQKEKNRVGNMQHKTTHWRQQLPRHWMLPGKDNLLQPQWSFQCKPTKRKTCLCFVRHPKWHCFDWWRSESWTASRRLFSETKTNHHVGRRCDCKQQKGVGSLILLGNKSFTIRKPDYGATFVRNMPLCDEQQSWVQEWTGTVIQREFENFTPSQA